MPWSRRSLDGCGATFLGLSALAYADRTFRKCDEASRTRRLARNGRIGADAAHARRARFRIDGAGVFLDFPSGRARAIHRKGNGTAQGREERELVEQTGFVHQAARSLLEDPASAILELDKAVTSALRDGSLPSRQFGFPLAGSLLPWIDKDLGNGQSREEWKGQAEGNKVLGREGNPIPIDGICVRIGAMRCHSQALTVKLRRDLPVGEIEQILAEANPWVRVVPNEREASLRELTPVAVSGTLQVPIGRLRQH